MFDLGGWHIGVYLMIAIDVAAVVFLGIAIAYGSRLGRETQSDFAAVRGRSARRAGSTVSGTAGPRVR